ncbi:MAG: transposase family protein [Gemmatimonadetes bacterium]|nr:transposase family protein [Gemmatimonadota bacterium]
MSDQLASGHRIRCCTVVDACMRENLLVAVNHSLPSVAVIAALDVVIATRGQPVRLSLDNGSAFRSRAFDAWAADRGITHSIQLHCRWRQPIVRQPRSPPCARRVQAPTGSRSMRVACARRPRRRNRERRACRMHTAPYFRAAPSSHSRNARISAFANSTSPETDKAVNCARLLASALASMKAER